MSFAGKLQRFVTDNVPWFLQGPNGSGFLQAFGLTLDTLTQTLITGLRQSSPLSAFVDNLPYIGADRGIRRYPTEPVQSYRTRLQRWRQIKHYAGTHYGQMISLQPYFLPNNIPTIRIFHQNGDGTVSTCHTLAPDGTYSIVKRSPSIWPWDAYQNLWSRFWVVIYVAGVGPDAAQYNDGTVYDDGVTVYDGHLNSAQIADIVGIILDSKAAHSALWGVILATDPDSFDPNSTLVGFPDGSTSLPNGFWGLPTKPDTGLPTRLSTAIYAYDAGVP